MAEVWDEIVFKRVLSYLELIPGAEVRLYSLLCQLSKNGRERTFAEVGYMYKRLGVSRSTYYRWRGRLIELGLISVQTRKDKLDHNLPSLITVASVKTIAKRMWTSVQAVVRPTGGTQKPVFSSETLKAQPKKRYKPTEIYRRLMAGGLKRGLGMARQPPFVENTEENQRKQREKETMREKMQALADAARKFEWPADGPRVLEDGTRQWASPILEKKLRERKG